MYSCCIWESATRSACTLDSREQHQVGVLNTDCNPGALWRSFKEADSLAGKWGLVHSIKKRPVSGSGRCCILDVTVSCSNGVESQQQNKKRAQDADIMSGCHGRMVRHIYAASLRMKLTSLGAVK
jgi:hypothetical protein